MENLDAEDLVSTQICLPRALRDELDALARKNGLLRGRSALLRNAVREYLDRHTLALRQATPDDRL